MTHVEYVAPAHPMPFFANTRVDSPLYGCAWNRLGIRLADAGLYPFSLIDVGPADPGR